MQPEKGSKTEGVYPNQILAKGKSNLLTFSMYFESCPPCVNEINSINAELKSLGLKSTDLNYSVVSSGEIDNPNIFALYSLSTIQENKWDFPVYLDTNFALSNSLGYTYFPQTLLIDKNGKLLYASDLSKDTILPMRMEKLSEKLIEFPRISESLLFLTVNQLERLTMMNKKPRDVRKYLASKGFYKPSSYLEKYRCATEEKNESPNYVEISFSSDSSVSSIELSSSRISDFMKYKQNFINAGYKPLPNKQINSNYFELSNDSFKVTFFNDVQPEGTMFHSPKFLISILAR